MKLIIVGRDHRESPLDIKDALDRAEKAIGGKTYDFEEPIDDAYYTFISDSDKIFHISHYELLNAYYVAINELGDEKVSCDGDVAIFEGKELQELDALIRETAQIEW